MGVHAYRGFADTSKAKATPCGVDNHSVGVSPVNYNIGPSPNKEGGDIKGCTSNRTTAFSANRLLSRAHWTSTGVACVLKFG